MLSFGQIPPGAFPNQPGRWGMEPPSQPTVVVELSAPRRLLLCTRGAADPAYFDELAVWCSQVDGPVATDHGWTLRTGAMRDVDDLGFELHWLWLFGFCILI